MADLTSKSELIRDLEKECDSIIITPFTASYELRALKSALRMAIKRIEKSPAVDAEPVVRCKECIRRYDTDECPMCYVSGGQYYEHTSGNGYCDRGERKDNG